MGTKEEVAKHTTKGDCWVILNDKVSDVTNFLSQHPGGELAILTFAGKDATEEFDMIHPPDVVGKYAPDAIIGVLGTAAQAAAPAPTAGAGPALKHKKDAGTPIANHHAWGDDGGSSNWRIEGFDDNPGVFIINVKSYVYAALYLWMAIIIEVLKTIFCNKNFKITNDRVGLTRSAMLLILFMVIHAVGNLHVFAGPDDFNGYGYFYVRLYWTGFGLPANIVEEYILLSAMLHVLVGLKRTWNKRKTVANNWSGGKKGEAFEQMKLAITGVMLLTFMTIHLFQFRFGDTFQYFLRPPPLLISGYGVPKLELFWTRDTSVPAVPVRDIYKLEYQLFNSSGNILAFFYIFSVCVFVTHACLGWKKVTPVLGIPTKHIPNVEKIGYMIMFSMGAIYVSFPLFCMLRPEFGGKEPSLQPTHPAFIPG